MVSKHCRDRLNIIVEWKNDGSGVMNRHFSSFLSFALKDIKECIVTLLVTAGNSKIARSAFLNRFPGREVVVAPGCKLPSGVHVYFPSLHAEPEPLRQAFEDGKKVVPHEAELNIEEEYHDFLHGYFQNEDTEWYARIFPDPIQITNLSKVNLGLGVTINPRAIILNGGVNGAGGMISIGRASHLGADLLLNLGPTDFVVGKFSMISANFSAHAMRHSVSHISNFAIGKGPFQFFGSLFDQTSPIKIGHDVWIGEGVKCLIGVEIGDGCVVGAGSVVTKSLEPYGVYAGNPARLLRYRFTAEKIEYLHQLRWWDFEFRRLKEIQKSFQCDVSSLTLSELQTLI